VVEIPKYIVNLFNIGLKLLSSSWLPHFLLFEMLRFDMVVRLEILNLVGPPSPIESKKNIL